MRDLFDAGRPERLRLTALRFGWRVVDRYEARDLRQMVTWVGPGGSVFTAPDVELLPEGDLRARCVVDQLAHMTGVCDCCGAVAVWLRGVPLWEHAAACPLGDSFPTMVSVN